MTLDFLRQMWPPLSDKTMESLSTAVVAHDVSLSMLAQLGMDGLATACNLDNHIERARLLEAVRSSPMAPTPRPETGGPLPIRVKFGFMDVSCIDTVAATVHTQFFVDLYYNDPRLRGATFVPQCTWRPTDLYVANQVGDMVCHYTQEKPTLLDIGADGRSKDGLLLWPSLYKGTLRNPMDLRNFPFDHDWIEVFLHQSESASAREYVFRPFADHTALDAFAEERSSVKFFFDVKQELAEWHMLGFSKNYFESVGGIPTAFSKCVLTMHMARRPQFYAWKVVLPLFICTVFCFSAFALDTSALVDRTNISLTLFLATSALLYVIASTVPRVGYLTAIDKLVIIVLLIQFLIGMSSLVIYYLRPPYALAADVCVCVTLLVLLFGSLMHYFMLPMMRTSRADRSAWPPTLERAPGVRYFCFETGVNIFAPSNPGPPPPWALPRPDMELDDDDNAPLLVPQLGDKEAGGAEQSKAGFQRLREEDELQV